MINKDYLEVLNPCKDRYDNYLTHYEDWSGTLEEFLDLPELTYSDKKWIFVRLIGNDKLGSVAADFAERALHIYENKYPNDDRPRKAIEAARSTNIYDVANIVRAAKAANNAYHDACSDDAFAFDAAYAARAASSAAYVTSYVFRSAFSGHAADTTNYVAYDAARAIYVTNKAYVNGDQNEEETAQFEIMKKYARELKG